MTESECFPPFPRSYAVIHEKCPFVAKILANVPQIHRGDTSSKLQRSISHFLLHFADIGLLYHFSQLRIIFAESRILMKLGEQLQYFRNLILCTHIDLEIHLLSKVRYFGLSVLCD